MTACGYKHQLCVKVQAKYLLSLQPLKADDFDRPARRPLQACRQRWLPLLTEAILTLLRLIHTL